MLRCRARKFTRLQAILGSCLACTFLSGYVLTAKPRAIIEPRVFVYQAPENFTAGYCARTSELGRQASVHHVGLLLTKDDGDILFEWLEHNSCHFSALLVLDGSSGPYAHNEMSSCANVVYYHENDFSDLKLYSDGELRELGHDLISKHFGYNIWITMAHTDEFFIHSPLSAIDFATKENADHIRWRALTFSLTLPSSKTLPDTLMRQSILCSGTTITTVQSAVHFLNIELSSVRKEWNGINGKGLCYPET